MKRFPGIPALILAALGVAATARAQQGPPDGPRPGSRRLEKCLASLDLPAAERESVEASLTTGHATLAADGEALRAAHARMQADVANGADKAALGQDVLDLEAARTKMKADARSVHDDVLAKLSTDQQDALNACASARGWHGKGARPSPGS